MNLTRPGVSWTYPYEVHPIYQQNQTIYGTFFGARDPANETIEVQIADLHYSSFIGAVDVLNGSVIEASATGKEAVNTSIGPSAVVKPARGKGIISWIRDILRRAFGRTDPAVSSQTLPPEL